MWRNSGKTGDAYQRSRIHGKKIFYSHGPGSAFLQTKKNHIIEQIVFAVSTMGMGHSSGTLRPSWTGKGLGP